MFCRKCGTKNPEDGKFCRKCGYDLVGQMQDGSEQPFVLEEWVQSKIAPHFSQSHARKKKKKKRDTWESAMGTLFMGAAFCAIAGVLAFQPMGQNWWFWLFIPAFAMLGSGVAQILRITYGNQENPEYETLRVEHHISAEEQAALPPKQTTYASEIPESPYETGEVVPRSVVENTTRHLEMDPDAKTTKLPPE